MLDGQRSGRLAWRVLAPAVVATAWACRPAAERVTPVEPVDPAAEVRLAAGTDPGITRFGDIPGVPTYEFESRAAISLRQHSYPSEGSDFDPAVSRDGQIVVFASTRHSLNPDVYYKPVDSVSVIQLTADPASDVQPAFSPDGQRVAFASDRTGNWDIWVVNIDGQQPIQVTTGEAHEVHPSWSPDGSQLVFCSMPERGGQWELWLASAEAGAVKKFIGYGLFPEWAPSSDTILYQRARRRGTHWFSLWTLKLVGGEPRMPTEILSSPEHAMILPAWSSDETQVAYCAVQRSEQPMEAAAGRPLQRSDVWMVDIDGRGRVRLTDGLAANYSPTWASTGRIFFTTDRAGGGQESIWSVVPLRGPMAADAAVLPDRFGRTHAERAAELRDQNTDSNLRTVGFPGGD